MGSFDLSGSVSEKDKTFIETWENVSDAVNYIVRENRRGDEEFLQIIGKRQFKLSTYDRMLTEDKIVDHRHNPFKNGCFRPVVVPHDITVDTNPNAMSSDDIRRLFGASDIAWDEYMTIIDSPATLQRMIDMADNGESEISHRRYQQLVSLRQQHSAHGKPILAQKDQDQYERINPSTGSLPEPQVSSPGRGPGRPRKTPA